MKETPVRKHLKVTWRRTQSYNGQRETDMFYDIEEYSQAGSWLSVVKQDGSVVSYPADLIYSTTYVEEHEPLLEVDTVVAVTWDGLPLNPNDPEFA